MRYPLKLITRADDAGLTVGTNRAIAAACAAGAMRNVGFMAVAPAVEDAAERLRDLRDVALGLHFALTCEWEAPLWGPLAAKDRVRSLLDKRGALPSTTAILHAQNIDLAEVVAEAGAQLARLRALGLAITYLDDHMACAWLPGVKAALHEFATREGLIFGPTEFSPLPRLTFPTLVPDPREMARMARPGVYLHFTHPACDDAEFRAFRADSMDVDKAILTRAAEAELWASAPFVDDLLALGVKPSRYDDVFKVGDRLHCANW
jgi:hypothetical protein